MPSYILIKKFDILRNSAHEEEKLCIKLVFFFIQFNVPFKIISLIESSQSIDGAKRDTPGTPPDTPASRTCLVSYVASAGLEPTPDKAVR